MADKEAFIKAIRENEALIYKVASFYTDNREDRDDLVQEIVYNLWKSFDSFKQMSSLVTWMYRVSMNVSIFHLKKKKRNFTPITITGSMLNLPEATTDETEERLHTLQNHIKDLNLLDKGIVMLYLENKSHDEIAQIVGISKTNVGTKLSRIKEKLKQQISKQQ